MTLTKCGACAVCVGHGAAPRRSWTEVTGFCTTLRDMTIFTGEWVLRIDKGSRQMIRCVSDLI